MATPDATVTPLPTPDDLAWLSELIGLGRAQIIELQEHLAEAFKYDDDGTTLTPRRTFESMTLERLGGMLVLAEDVRRSARHMLDLAAKIQEHTHDLFQQTEDARADVVATPAGLESYVGYRRRNTERLRDAAEDAARVLAELEGRR